MNALERTTRLIRTILFFLLMAGALAGVVANAQQQTKRPRKSKSTDSSASDQADAQAAQHAQIIRENNFGVALMNRQQFEQALGKFQRACILEPQSDVGCVNTGIALLNMQRFDEARQIVEKSAERDPRNPRVWFNLGLLEKAVGKSHEAIADFQKVAQLDPYDADTQYFIGLMYSQEQKYDEAIAAFKRALDLNPFQVSAEFGLAQALQRKNDTAHAKEHFDRFQHLVSEKLGKPVSFIYGEQGKYSLAELMMPAPEPVAPLYKGAFCKRYFAIRAARPAVRCNQHSENPRPLSLLNRMWHPNRSHAFWAVELASLITTAMGVRTFFWWMPMARAMRRSTKMKATEDL